MVDSGKLLRQTAFHHALSGPRTTENEGSQFRKANLAVVDRPFVDPAKPATTLRKLFNTPLGRLVHSTPYDIDGTSAVRLTCAAASLPNLLHLLVFALTLCHRLSIVILCRARRPGA